jgi:uncharacterized protein (TIGR03086 family)
VAGSGRGLSEATARRDASLIYDRNEDFVEDVRKLHRQAGAMIESVMERIPAEAMTNPTPCDGWDVRALINHLVTGHRFFAALITGAEPPDREADFLGDDHMAAFRDSFDALCELFDREGVLEQTFQTPIGEGPGAMLVSMRITDTTMHAWDLSAATGQPRDLDPVLLAFVEQMVKSRDIPRGPGGPFGEEQPAPEGASAADRLAAYLGRKVPDGR